MRDVGEPLRSWAETIRALDARLKPIAERPLNLHDPDWRAKLAARPPAVDEAGIRVEAETLLVELVDDYAVASSERREHIRQLFDTYRSFAWGAMLPQLPLTPATLRRRLLHFSILDLGRDTRDAILALQDICQSAEAVGLATADVLKEVAALSSDRDKHGMGSTRDLLLRAV
jgi:hypothetical protein